MSAILKYGQTRKRGQWRINTPYRELDMRRLEILAETYPELNTTQIIRLAIEKAVKYGRDESDTERIQNLMCPQIVRASS